MDKINVLGIILFIIGIVLFIFFPDLWIEGFNCVTEGISLYLSSATSFDFMGFYAGLSLFTWGLILMIPYAIPLNLGLFLILA